MVKRKNFGKVAVLMGGTSKEREISLISGKAVFEALIRSGVDAHAIDVGHDLIEQLEKGKFDRAFIILHGRFGEDGVVQGLLETMKIPYTGSGVLASALSMDKVRSKLILHSLGLPTLSFQIVANEQELDAAVEEFGLPLCLKPVHEGSSNGVSCVTDKKDLMKAFEYAKSFNDDVIAEPWVSGRELTVPILNNKPLPVIEMIAKNGFYDYEAKYFSNETKYECPAKLTKAQTKQIQDLAKKAFDALGCSSWSRVDFLMNRHEQIVIMENNTVPGMTSHSLVPMAAKEVGISFDELVLEILSHATLSGVW